MDEVASRTPAVSKAEENRITVEEEEEERTAAAAIIRISCWYGGEVNDDDVLEDFFKDFSPNTIRSIWFMILLFDKTKKTKDYDSSLSFHT